MLSETIKPYLLNNQKQLVKINGVCHASKSLQERNVAERLSSTAKSYLMHNKVPIDIRTEYHDSYSDGCGITLWALFSDGENTDILGADCLGEKNISAEEIAAKAADELNKEISSGAAVDKKLADQILPFIAMIPKSLIRTSEITKHCETNKWIVEQFLGKLFESDNKNSVIKVIK
jgi:RNA 3'-terminal phosphate cyclase